MPLVLVATVGAANANALIDRTAAQAILDGVPNTTSWDGADSAAQDKALVYATTLLNVLAYLGMKTSTTQALAFPRAWVIDPDYSSKQYSTQPTGPMLDTWPGYLDPNTIPVRMQRGCAQLALAILRAGTKDIWGVEPTRDIKRKVVGPLETEWVTPAQRRFGLRAFPAVWREIYPLTLACEPATVERA